MEQSSLASLSLSLSAYGDKDDVGGESQFADHLL